MKRIVIASLTALLVTLTSGLVLAQHGSSQTDNRRNSYAFDQCKGGGWKNLEDDENKAFRNQGQCIRFFNQPDTYDSSRYN